MNLNYTHLLPEIILSLTGIMIMLVIPFVSRNQQVRLGYPTLAGICLAFLVLILEWNQTGPAFFGMVLQDPFSQFCKALFLFSTAAIVLITMTYLKQENLAVGELYPLLLFATVGMCLMAAGADLIISFLGLEILSISTYILVGFKKRNYKSNESAIKYFLLGAFSTTFLLYGIAFVYGATGSTKYLIIAESIHTSNFEYHILLWGLGLMLVGFGFKIALAPFHIWAPDVYEGAPLPVMAHLAVGVKISALIVLTRILFQVLPELSQEWQLLLWVSAVLTMGIGNIAALTQTNIKRMLAYSSIAHAGYLLLGLTAHNELSLQGILYYLVAYTLMTLGALTVVQILGGQNEHYIQIEDYAGIGYRYPFLGIALSIFLISLAGIPTTAGFMGKFLLFAATLKSGMYGLIILAIIASAIGIYYYLRVIVSMYMGELQDERSLIDIPLSLRIVILIMVLGTVYLGTLPGTFLNLAIEVANF